MLPFSLPQSHPYSLPRCSSNLPNILPLQGMPRTPSHSLLHDMLQMCAGKCLTTRSLERKLELVAFAHFHGVNTLTLADFKLPTTYHWTRSWEQMGITGSLVRLHKPTPAHHCPKLTMGQGSLYSIRKKKYISLYNSMTPGQGRNTLWPSFLGRLQGAIIWLGFWGKNGFHQEQGSRGPPARGSSQSQRRVRHFWGPVSHGKTMGP